MPPWFLYKQDKAAAVLKRSAEDDNIDPEVSAAATSLMACLTETSMQLNSPRLGGSGSLQEAKLEGLRAAILAYSRHPSNVLLFRSLLHLALSNLQRARVAQTYADGAEDVAWESTVSPIELLLMQTSLDTLSNFTERELPKTQQAIFREKIWSDFGELICCFGHLSVSVLESLLMSCSIRIVFW